MAGSRLWKDIVEPGRAFQRNSFVCPNFCPLRKLSATWRPVWRPCMGHILHPRPARRRRCTSLCLILRSCSSTLIHCLSRSRLRREHEVLLMLQIALMLIQKPRKFSQFETKPEDLDDGTEHQCITTGVHTRLNSSAANSDHFQRFLSSPPPHLPTT